MDKIGRPSGAAPGAIRLKYGRRRFLFKVAAGFTFAGTAAAIGAAPAGAETPAAQPHPRLMVLGDSLAAGFGLPTAEAFPARLEAALRANGHDIQVINAGVSGDTSAGGVARLDWILRQASPRFAIVEFGGNDGLRGLSPAAMQDNLTRIVERLKAAGVGVLIAGMLAPPNLGREYGAEFSQVFARVAEQQRVALYPFFLDGVAADPALNQQDGLHPNAQGVERIVARILPYVERLIAGEAPS
jgi:acyl-CoA thioesterase-1